MIISVFSPLWFCVIAVGVLLAVFLRQLLLKKDRKVRLNVLEKLSLVTAAFWILYKTSLSLDPTYDFKFFNELPLHLCNICTVFCLVAARKDNKTLQAFVYYISALGALLACLTPDSSFVGISVLQPRAIGYWLYHILMMVIPISFVTLNIYRPVLKDILRSFAILLGIALVTFLINLLLRATVYPEANYCYSFGMEGNLITDTLQKFIPIPVLYLVPMLIPVGLADALLALPGRKK